MNVKKDYTRLVAMEDTKAVEAVPGKVELPAVPKAPTPATLETGGGATGAEEMVGQLTEAAGAQNAGGGAAVSGGSADATPTEQKPAQTYNYEQLVAYQNQEAAADRAERAAGANFIRVGSKYTNTPNERTIKLSQPFDGMWYYDPGEKVYAGTPGSEAYFDENGNWKAPAGYAPQVGSSGSAGGTAGTSKFGNTGSSGSSLTALLEEWKKAAAEQANGQIDYAVAQAITELERALEDAQPAFREAAEAVSREEAQALDNSALYAELRGDKGGIGQSQYNEIQAAAAQNRLAVQQAQTKLATDTARQIADLRAQGEFEKADKMLEITQTYLSQLISLEQWAAEFGFSQQQFQASLNQWQAEYDLAMKEFDFNTTQTQSNKYADIGSALLSAGIMPDAKQLAAMGMTEAQAKQYLTQLQLEKALGDQTGGGFRMPSTNAELYQMLKEAGATNADEAKTQLALWEVSSPGNYVGGFEDWLKRNSDEGNGGLTFSDLGAEARKIYDLYVSGTGMPTPALMASLISEAEGRISENEAKFLLSLVGY